MGVQGEQLSTAPELVAGIMMLMLLASLTAMVGTRLPRLPFTIALVLVGAVIGALVPHIPQLGLLSDFQLTPELVLFVFLPTLIFESANNLDVRQLQSNLLPVLTLAIPGLLISTGIIGGLFYLFTDWDFIICLLLGSILSATDPVAVIALFKQLGVPERLTVLVEGESLFNDATSLVLATLLLSIALSGEFSGGTIAAGLGDFLFVFFGGILVGWVLALVVCQVLGAVDAQAPVEISLTTVLAYSSFLLAEHSLHVSGIMAVVAAGLTVGSYGRSKISPSTEAYLHDFWDYAAWLANALIFLLVGMRVDLIVYWDSIELVALVAVAMLLSRAVVVFGLVPQLARLPDSEPVSRGYQMVMYWGGLRGAIALAIVLSLPEFGYRDMMTAVVMGAVLFTLLVQGLSIETLVNKLGLNKPEFADLVAEREGALHAKEASLASVDRLEQGGFFSQRVALRLRKESEQTIAQLREGIAQLTANMSAEQASRTLTMRTLSREKTRYDELFRRGLIGEWAYRELTHNVEQQLDDAKHYGRLPSISYRHASLHTVSGRFLQLLTRVPIVGRWVENRQHHQMMRDYDVSWARYRAATSVLKNLDEIAAENGVEGTVVEVVREAYSAIHKAMHTEISQVGESYPEFVEAAQERLGNRLLIISEQDSVRHAAELGILPDGVASAIHKQQEQRLRELRRTDLSSFLEVGAEELLSKVPMFAALDSEQFASMIPHLHLRSFPKGEAIIRQGDKGDSLFMIARGLVSVFREEEGAKVELERLYAGDFFGEAALLHASPRNATVRATTPCTLYELGGEEWSRICGKYPGISEAVADVDEQRNGGRA
jgi:CPA1 family monovalent cation:H+ antiporter